jgi:two-component system cell cycle sensor histidine kinase/response regulator CckA
MGAARILVVDDEPVILELVSRALSSHGFDVLETLDPLAAVEMAAAPPPVDLVLTDVVMPGMAGPEMVRTIRETWPATRAIFMSGFAASPDLPPDIPFISKPFRVSDLIGKVREILAAEPGVRRRTAMGGRSAP